MDCLCVISESHRNPCENPELDQKEKKKGGPEVSGGYTTYRDYEPQLELRHQHTRNCNRTASLTSNGGGLALRLLFSLGCSDFRNINSGPSRIPAVGGHQKREQKEDFCRVGTAHTSHHSEMPGGTALTLELSWWISADRLSIWG